MYLSLFIVLIRTLFKVLLEFQFILSSFSYLDKTMYLPIFLDEWQILIFLTQILALGSEEQPHYHFSSTYPQEILVHKKIALPVFLDNFSGTSENFSLSIYLSQENRNNMLPISHNLADITRNDYLLSWVHKLLILK